MPELVITSGVNAGTVFVLPDEPVVVGRAPVCHIQLGDPWISSAHARIEPRGHETWVVDLGSSNGTWLGEQRVNEVRLAPGGEIRFGKTVAQLRAKNAGSSEALLRQAGTLFRPIAEVASSLAQVGAAAPRNTLGPATEESGGVSAYRRQVALLNEIGRALVDAADVDASLAKILDTIARAVRAERASLLVSDEAGLMTPRVSIPRNDVPWYSRTLIDAAVQNRAGRSPTSTGRTGGRPAHPG